MSIVEDQLAGVLNDFPGTQVIKGPDGSTVVKVPAVGLPIGWNCSSTTVEFLTPPGYPLAQPDCFWTCEDLRLESGAQPKNTALQVPSFCSTQRLWFSWHLASWNGSRDTLRSYMRTILARLLKPE